jgi:hypothetical protein
VLSKTTQHSVRGSQSVLVVCAGSVEQQLAGLKLQPGAAHSRRHSADRISASVSPEPEATAAPEHHTYAAAGQAPSSSSSHDSTPLVEDRAQGLQKTLQTVRMKLAAPAGEDDVLGVTGERGRTRHHPLNSHRYGAVRWVSALWPCC